MSSLIAINSTDTLINMTILKSNEVLLSSNNLRTVIVVDVRGTHLGLI